MENGNNALQVVPEAVPVATPLEIKAPDVVLREASKASKALAEVLQARPKKIVINGKRHLEFDDWQTVARFYSLAVRTFDAVPTEIEGVKGAKAKAEVIDAKSGIVVGGAESYCLRDEVNWKIKPWFQLASMAQTRAGAKALRNVLSWVVVLAGFSPTPAEEMLEPTSEPESTKAVAHKSGVTPMQTITEAQGKRLYAIWKSAGKSDAEVRKHLSAEYGIESTRQIPTDLYEEICDWAGKK